MPRVTVPMQRFEAGLFPPICVRTGAPGDVDLVIQGRYNPPWVAWMLLFGILPFIVATHFASQRHTGSLPVSAPFGQKLRLAHLRQRIAFGIAIALLIAALVAQSAVVAWTGVAALVIATGLFMYFVFVDVRLRMDETSVTIKNAHQRFIDALRAQGSV